MDGRIDMGRNGWMDGLIWDEMDGWTGDEMGWMNGLIESDDGIIIGGGGSDLREHTKAMSPSYPLDVKTPGSGGDVSGAYRQCGAVWPFGSQTNLHPFSLGYSLLSLITYIIVLERQPEESSYLIFKLTVIM